MTLNDAAYISTLVARMPSVSDIVNSDVDGGFDRLYWPRLAAIIPGSPLNIFKFYAP